MPLTLLTRQVTETAKLLGLSSIGHRLPLAYALAPLLFTGPLYAAYLDEELPSQKNSGYFEFGRHEMRNYVVVSCYGGLRLTCIGSHYRGAVVPILRALCLPAWKDEHEVVDFRHAAVVWSWLVMISSPY